MIRKALFLMVASVVAFGFVGCRTTGSDTILIDNLPEAQELSGDTIVTPLYEYLTSSVLPAGDYVLARSYKANFLFFVFDNDFNLQDTIVRKGQGPNEMIEPMYFGQWTGTASNPIALIFEENKNRFSEIALHPFDTITPGCVLPASAKLSPSRAYLLSDSVCAGITLDVIQGSTPFKYNFNTKELVTAESPFEFNRETAFYSSQCNMAIKDDGGILAVAYNSFPALIIYDKDLKLRKKIFIGDKEIDPMTFTTGEPTYGFQCTQFYNDKIITLLEAPSDKTNKLIILDKHYKPLAQYGVGKSFNFYVDQKKQRIVTVGYDANLDAAVIITYPLPEELAN